MKRIYPFVALIALAILSALSCQKGPEEILGTVTGEATHISCRNARLSGNVTMPQTTSPYTSFGVLYSTSTGIIIGSANQLEATESDAENCFTVDTGAHSK